MPSSYSDSQRRRQLDMLSKLNREHLERIGGHPELEARIRSYELAYHMQSSVPELFDLSKETVETQKLYGIDGEQTGAMGKHCLGARRMVEAGVRFVQIR